MTTTTAPAVTAAVEAAGRKMRHSVKHHGVTVGTRMSERRYHFAICRDYRRDGRTYVVAVRWSDSPKCRSNEYAVRVIDAR